MLTNVTAILLQMIATARLGVDHFAVQTLHTGQVAGPVALTFSSGSSASYTRRSVRGHRFAEGKSSATVATEIQTDSGSESESGSSSGLARVAFMGAKCQNVTLVSCTDALCSRLATTVVATKLQHCATRSGMGHRVVLSHTRARRLSRV